MNDIYYTPKYMSNMCITGVPQVFTGAWMTYAIHQNTCETCVSQVHLQVHELSVILQNTTYVLHMYHTCNTHVEHLLLYHCTLILLIQHFSKTWILYTIRNNSSDLAIALEKQELQEDVNCSRHAALSDSIESYRYNRLYITGTDHTILSVWWGRQILIWH